MELEKAVSAVEASLIDEVKVIAKSEGLDLLEDSAVAITRAAFRIVKVAVPKVNIAVAAIVIPILELIEPKVLSLLDKIDGKDDPNY
jgi:hypothetical protein